MVQLATKGSQAGFDIAETFAVRQLREGHRQILIPAREASRSGIALVASHATTELSIRQEAQQLGEDGPTLVHGPLSPF
jgi:hypothetical protein